MDSVGTFEAKTHLTRLLERVAKGEANRHHQSRQGGRHARASRGGCAAGCRGGRPGHAGLPGQGPAPARRFVPRPGASKATATDPGGRSMSLAPAPERLVLDGSVSLAWLFHDEKDPYADAVVAKLPAVEMLVPRLWHLEIANVLLVNRAPEAMQPGGHHGLAVVPRRPADRR